MGDLARNKGSDNSRESVFVAPQHEPVKQISKLMDDEEHRGPTFGILSGDVDLESPNPLFFDRSTSCLTDEDGIVSEENNLKISFSPNFCRVHSDLESGHMQRIELETKEDHVPASWMEFEVVEEEEEVVVVEQRVSIPKDRKEMYSQMFDMYDLDSSNRIDSEEEVRGLFMNSWFKFFRDHSAKPADIHIHHLIQQLGDGHSGYNKDEWSQWFERNVYLKHQCVEL